MNQLDAYYRALVAYRQYTTANRECSSLRSAMGSTDPERDKIVVQRAICTIDEDWVDAIEKGLVHVEKAIKEERQFIRSNGEVVPIEKVRNVSKESVEHLAKHSSLITRFEEGEDIIPDKLYTVERLSDYAVYENRFLYMLLCYLRDFVTIRHNKILDLTNKYDSSIEMSKTVVSGKQTLKYSISMHDQRRDDPYLQEHNRAKDIIDRISLILKTILAFLATPLMESVSKVAMIKPPITKTNVLKMNNNFKGAVALYEFIVAYDKPGYTVKNETTTLSPFREELADEMAEALSLVPFLAYEHGLGIKDELKDAFNREEDRRRIESVKQNTERLAAIEKKLKKGGVSPEEYILALEKQLKALEGELTRSEALLNENEALGAKLHDKDLHISRLSKEMTELEEQIEDINKAHFDELEQMRARHTDELHAMLTKNEAEIKRLKENHATLLAELQQKHDEEIDALNATVEDAKQECASAIREADERVNAAERERDAFKADYDAIAEAKLLSDARIKALGGITDTYTDRESFGILEREFLAFKKLYSQQWELAKRKIRKDLLNAKKLKGQNESDEDSD